MYIIYIDYYTVIRIVIMFLLYCYYEFFDCYIVILTTKLPSCQRSRNQISGLNCRGINCRGINCPGLNCRGINCRPPLLIPFGLDREYLRLDHDDREVTK